MTLTHFRWLVRAAVLMLLISVLAIGLIASGIFDPTPVGTPLWQMEERQMLISPQSRDIIWLEEEVPDLPITIRLSAARKSGEKDTGYGLVVGDEVSFLAVAVSPLGYLAIWESEVQSESGTDSFLLPWQTWPHVKTGSSPNEIWVDIVGSRATVRVNREWLWEGEITNGPGHVGLLGESFAETAVIDFESLELFAESGG